MGHGRILTDQPLKPSQMSTPTQIASDVIQNPKVASAAVSLWGMVNLYLGYLHSAGEWFFQNINYISGAVGLILSIAIYRMQKRKLKREMQIADEEHAVRMRQLRRRVTDR